MWVSNMRQIERARELVRIDKEMTVACLRYFCTELSEEEYERAVRILKRK